MIPTFSPTFIENFFALFARANQAIWPMQIVWYVAALAVVVLAIRPTSWSSRVISLFLAAYYVWVGIVFFWMFQSQIDNGAGLHGAMYVLGGVLLLFAGVVRQDLTIRAEWNVQSVVGGFFVLYALAFYPLIGMLGGHTFPAMPVFGIAPCTAPIIGFGLLVWARGPVPKFVLLVPLLWSLIAIPSDLGLGVYEDIGMVAASLIGTAWIIWRDRTSLRESVLAGVALVVLVAFTGNNDVLLGLGLILLLVTVAQEFGYVRGGVTPSSPKGRLSLPVR
jgi:hypothetical protein